MKISSRTCISLTSEDFSEMLEPTEYQASNSRRGIVPDFLGKGFVQETSLNNEMWVNYTETEFNRNTTLSAKMYNPSLIMGFCLSGSSSGYVKSIDEKLSIRQGESFISFDADPEGVFEYPSCEKIRYLEISIPPDYLNVCEVNQVGGEMISYARKSEDQFFFQTAMSPEMGIALHQLMQNSFHGISKEIYMKSKILELLSLHLYETNTDHVSCEKIPLKSHQIEKIKQARNVLMENFDDPPTIDELASEVGLNSTTFKTGFKAVYGNTVYRYLREKRMDNARLLFDAGATSVINVACRVGYSNPSHFAAAFKDRFGINPGEYLSAVSKITTDSGSDF